MALTDLPGLIPISVTCAFPKTVDGVWSGENYVKTTTLASLALAEFTGALANANTHVLHPSAVAAYVGAGVTPSNQTELDAMAGQMATDWYRWQLGKANVAFNGTVSFVPCGLVDAIEWDWDQPRPRTSVYRAPFNDMASKRLTSTGAGGSIVNFYFSLYVVNAYITNLWVTETVNWTNVYVTFVNVTYDVDVSFYFSYYGDTIYLGHLVTNVCPSIGYGSGAGTSTTINSGTWTTITGSAGVVVGPEGTQPAYTGGTAFCTASNPDVFELALVVNGNRLSASTFKPWGSAIDLEIPLRPGVPDLDPGNNDVEIQARRTSGSGSMTVNSAVWAIKSGTSITVEHPGPVCFVDPDTCCTTEGPRDPPDEPPVVTACCSGVAVPRTLYATPSGQTGTCGCVGDVVTLEYNAVSEKWEGTTLDCGVSINFRFYCYSDPSWSLEIVGPAGQVGYSAVPDSCGDPDPFSCVFTANFVLVDDGICTGNVTWTITETP